MHVAVSGKYCENTLYVTICYSRTQHHRLVHNWLDKPGLGVWFDGWCFSSVWPPFWLTLQVKTCVHQAVTAAVSIKVKAYGEKKKKVKKSANKFLFSFMIHIFNSTPHFNPCLFAPTKTLQRLRSVVLATHYFTHFQSELKTNLRAPFKEHQTLTLRCDYKWSTFNSQPGAGIFIVLAFFFFSKLNSS